MGFVGHTTQVGLLIEAQGNLGRGVYKSFKKEEKKKKPRELFHARSELNVIRLIWP
jgi:hypothetical protein